MNVVYPNLFFNEVCYKGMALYIGRPAHMILVLIIYGPAYKTLTLISYALQC